MGTTFRCRSWGPAAARGILVLVVLLSVQACLGFHLGSMPKTVNRIKGQRRAAVGPRVAGETSTRSTPRRVMMSLEMEGQDDDMKGQRREEAGRSLGKRIPEGVGKEWGRAVFGMMTAFGAGYAVPATHRTIKAIKNGEDVSSILQEALRPPSAEALSLKPYSRRSLKEKLASIPCFLVCNRAGNPYLVPLESNFDVGVVFLDPQDAEEMMQNMIQNPAMADARVMAMGLDKGLSLIRQEPRANGHGVLVFQFCPSVQQLQNANGFRKIGWKAILEKRTDKWRWGFNRQAVKNAGIPVFYCPDLRIMKGREAIKTFFFSLEDLYYAWDRAENGQGEKPEVITLDFLRTLEWMMNEPEQARNCGFHADTQAQEYVEQGLKLKGGKAKIRQR